VLMVGVDVRSAPVPTVRGALKFPASSLLGSVELGTVTGTRKPTRSQQPQLGSVLAQMAFPLHASEISDKSETGREKHVSVSAELSHFFPFKKVLYQRGQNVTFFGKDVTKNVTS